MYVFLQVRANSLQELVYKQGQAGVTKATVSIVFNNSDSANGPVEYQHLDQITVTRQVPTQATCVCTLILSIASRWWSVQTTCGWHRCRYLVAWSRAS